MRAHAWLCAAMTFSLAAAAAAQDARVETGATLFKQYCAACHGLDAKGAGPAAPALSTKPADLTMIQKRGEEFPAMRVMSIISGEREVASHGSREMPIWGRYFRDMDGKGKEAININSLTEYLKSIQRFHE